MDSEMFQMMAMLDSLGVPRPSGPNDPRLRATNVGRSVTGASLTATADDDVATLIEQLQRAKAQYEEDKERGPAPRPRQYGRRAILATYVAETRRKLLELSRGKQFLTRTTYVGFPKHTSKTPLEQLVQTRLSTMSVRMTHIGHFLICRTFTPPVRQVGVELGIEDPDGEVELCSLYNFPETFMAARETLDEIFPVGTVFAIREPTLKMNSTGTNAMIRVDSPSDIVILHPADTLMQKIVWRTPSPRLNTPQTVIAWKERGNSHFKQGRFFAASVAYTRGLELEPKSHTLLLNRALAYLNLGYFSSALRDAETVSSADAVERTGRVKAVFRSARACYGLQLFARANDLFQNVLALDPEQRDSIAWLRRCASRIEELNSGDDGYDWVGMFTDCQASPFIDVADWLGPIRVASLPSRGGGRGLVTTRPVKAGELLMVSKACAASFPRPMDDDPREVIMGLNSLTNLLETQSQVELLYKTITRVLESSSTASAIYGLYAGPQYPAPPLRFPGEDGRTGAFSSRASTDADVLWIENICKFNSFFPVPLRHATFKRSDAGADSHEMTQPSALFLLPSLANHACAGTASYVFFGDVIVIRATQALNAGDEVTMPYSGRTSYLDRKKALDKHVDSCDCWLCREERADGADNLGKREEITKHLRRDMEAGTRPTVASARQTIKRLEATYRAGAPAIRPAMASAHHTLAHVLSMEAFHQHTLYPAAARADMDALEALGIKVVDKTVQGRIARNRAAALPIATTRAPVFYGEVPMISLMIVAAFCSMSDEQRARRWLAAAQWLHNVSYGGGEALFRLVHKEILDKTGIRTFLRL
ncbi:hypothetical protein AURDEDRAFT_181176 [Auricularia subglabra TFB-10046 SS5]|nr:hypothetical protein AURDEDRAFT_181176 [Auricularia subglabra TFB-10046 SS5]